jgi:hypothetical protein
MRIGGLVTDLVIGGAANYQWETGTDCTYQFVVSLRQSGYKGRCVFIVSAPLTEKTVRKYEEYEVELVMVTPKDSQDYPHVFRFRAIPQVIKSIPDLRYVMALDTKDIVFQSDPTKWLEQNLDEKKVVGFKYPERHKDSEYARNLFTHFYGSEMYKAVENRQVSGVGIICGLAKEVGELSQAISDLCDKRLVHNIENSYMVPEQQAFNWLLSQEPWLSSFEALPVDYNGLISLGTGDFKDGVLYSPFGAPYVLYHHTGSPDREVILRDKYHDQEGKSIFKREYYA